ncbi:hypothetical protein ABB37_05414 [Leptomonas pyrrhocoris]|uniref:Uncharacterized protein n=1 Tax=Leptomonas pyrrhocoris TaxID=157538 RepID=A0A0M9G0E3_LEPPY|nr:hypothetical protein ABB37_05414 [Leptomonas pyrrhocoris]XP_015658057.1 hypothetical protein ABB37_05414 [Leptomonas pyrrhocoris]KPA79617.1 hypothetical protein ABB37_05414 [Leptomonas pyrrhocoris]KPA79618.1 hypothetical protein ABB37_05414 [Leptomonas pyrrhocoris]|eukprot:XP_015658056.1 hypothetical protein ABB37_05414 [Leptomonas pyrrhocoris]
MSTSYPFLTLGDVYDYLPNFNPDYELQVGDWVVIQPWRISTLLDPLIAVWEQKSVAQGVTAPGSPCGPAPQYTLDQLLPEPLNLRRRALSWNGEGSRLTHSRFPRLARLSMARGHFCQRKRRHVLELTGRKDSEAGCEHMEAESDNLYFHMRLGLLTPSRPYIFGGLDIVEVLACPSEEDNAGENGASETTSDAPRTAAPSTMYLNLLTGETLTREEAVSRVSNALAYASATPTWSSPIEEAAEKEWQQWVARRVFKLSLPQPCS